METDIDYDKYKFPKVNFDREEIQNEWFSKSVSDFYIKMEAHKNDFIEYKIKEKGYDELLKTTSHRFPRIRLFLKEHWLYVYADNGTVDGDFIVAIQDYSPTFDYNEKNFSTQLNMYFKWQDTSPL